MYRETPGSGNVQELLEEFWPLEGYGIIDFWDSCGIQEELHLDVNVALLEDCQ